MTDQRIDHYGVLQICVHVAKNSPEKYLSNELLQNNLGQTV